jgi:hypothetical protein
MTNQDTDDPQVHAHLGLVRIPAGSCCEGQRWEEYTVEAARELIADLVIAKEDARQQRKAIEEACAQGHDWTDGWNHIMDGDKVTMRSCTRDGCEGRRIDPGWLPFEPKQHLVPYSSKLWDCTGPGCHYCVDESFADAFNRNLTSAVKKLNDEFLPLLGDKAAGLEFDTTPIVAKKLGMTWSVDATPEQVQAALDARNGDQP